MTYRKYSLDYATEEEHAHLAKVDMWSGTFDMLWIWRFSKAETMKPQQETSAQEVMAGLVERVTFHDAENGFAFSGSRRMDIVT